MKKILVLFVMALISTAGLLAKTTDMKTDVVTKKENSPVKTNFHPSFYVYKNGAWVAY